MEREDGASRNPLFSSSAGSESRLVPLVLPDSFNWSPLDSSGAREHLPTNGVSCNRNHLQSFATRKMRAREEQEKRGEHRQTVIPPVEEQCLGAEQRLMCSIFHSPLSLPICIPLFHLAELIQSGQIPLLRRPVQERSYWEQYATRFIGTRSPVGLQAQPQRFVIPPSPSSPRRRRLSVRHRKAGRWRGPGTRSAAATLDACRALPADHLSYGDRWGNPPAGA
ncbi:unnamed protein product [Pleuronectes platessa]|uniref:Uncharacterized protein n=1 Tax=Pleuronectes platessa TaxID=8262 RepID=A0A9N7Y7Z3_PLEPL|nr:unnamed protein product [Pleuronectes platessa]